MILILCDHNPEMVRAWEQAFAGCEDVEIRCGDFTDVSADALVSPANSFGQMDGGLDLALREYFGAGLQDLVTEALETWGGMLPVGEAVVVETGDDGVPYLIVAPTMEVPSVVAHTNNAFRAMRAVLCAARRAVDAGALLESVAVPGLATGVGKMHPLTAAAQMRDAWDEYRAS